MSSGKNKKRPAPSNNNTAVTDTIKPVDRPAVVAEEDPVLKEEILRWILSILGTLVAYWCVAFVIQKAYHPDTSAALAEANKLLIEPGAARPEPMEAMLFRAGVVVITLGLLSFYAFFSKAAFIKELAKKSSFMVVSLIPVVLIAFMLWFDFAAQNPFVKDGGDIPQNSRDFVGKTNFDFYFDGFFLGKYLLPYIFVLVPGLACLFFFGLKKFG